MQACIQRTCIMRCVVLNKLYALELIMLKVLFMYIKQWVNQEVHVLGSMSRISICDKPSEFWKRIGMEQCAYSGAYEMPLDDSNRDVQVNRLTIYLCIYESFFCFCSYFFSIFLGY